MGSEMCIRDRYVGGYEDWFRKGGQLTKIGESHPSVSKPSNKKSSLEHQASVKKSGGLSAKERKELKHNLLLIERLETEQSRLEKIMSKPNFYDDSEVNIEKTLQEFANNKMELETLYKRWEQLEEAEK